jgi:thioredoxin-dependent peroxiredoxin
MSRDSVASHKAFVDKFGLTFTLLSDQSGAVAKSYGSLSDQGKTQRKTFIINPDGQIAKEYPKVATARHFDEVLADLKVLAPPCYNPTHEGSTQPG